MNNDVTNPKTMTKEDKRGLKVVGCAGLASIIVVVLFLFSLFPCLTTLRYLEAQKTFGRF